MISHNTLQKVAHLARLELTKEELSLFNKDIEEALEQFEKLARAPIEEGTTSITPTSSATVLRADKPLPSTTAAAALELSTHKQGSHYKGPKAI